MSNRDSKYKKMFAAIVVLGVGLIGFNFLSPSGPVQDTKYMREQTRQTIKLAETEFIINLKHGNSLVTNYFGHQWNPMPMPIKEKYQGLLKEKLVFLRSDQTLQNYTELLTFDVYTNAAFPNCSEFLKHHARELEKKNKDGRIKILHDGEKGIIYQWITVDENNKTNYLEFGKVEMTDEGLLSVKYISKGTENLEHQRQCAIKLFTKF